jgi:hypothetical protein
MQIRYTKTERIKQKLQGKVKFGGPGDTDPNKMSADLLTELIVEAETQLQLDLMRRYNIPLQPINGGSFSNLVDNTRVIITMMAELLSVIRVLETDFGRGTAANGDKYMSGLQKRYDAILKPLMEYRKDSQNAWLNPPLEGLQLSYQNQGDTGFRGRVMNTTTIPLEADWAVQQINSPGETLWDGHINNVRPHGVGHDE